MAPFESRETLEPTAYDGPVSASRRHSRLRHGCEARRARGQQTFSRRNESCLPIAAKLLPGLSGRTSCKTKRSTPFTQKKGALLRATLWKHRARLLLLAAQRSAGLPAPPCFAPPGPEHGGLLLTKLLTYLLSVLSLSRTQLVCSCVRSVRSRKTDCTYHFVFDTDSE